MSYSFKEFELEIYPFSLIVFPSNKEFFTSGYNDTPSFLSEESFDYHHGKHHKAYVNNLNMLLEKADKDFQSKTIKEVILSAKDIMQDNKLAQQIYNNACQVWNHSFFWHCLSALGRPTEGYQIFQLIAKQYNTWEHFMQKFIDVSISHFGSGWSWLVFDKSTKEFDIFTTKDAATCFDQRPNCAPIFTCDLWEHAYYIDFRNDRKKYVQIFLSYYLNWHFMESNYKETIEIK